MPKFKAPEHVTSIFTGGVEYRADKNGVATLPADAPVADIRALEAHGWTRLDGATKPAKAAAPRKSSGKSGAKKAKPPAEQPPTE